MQPLQLHRCCQAIDDSRQVDETIRSVTRRLRQASARSANVTISVGSSER
jgi:hypothetical protein